jgi:hypothetical protein
VLHLLGDDGEPVRQHLTANIANFFYHVSIRFFLSRIPEADSSI